MQVPLNVFREYDIRGLIATQLTPAFAEQLGRAFATAAWEQLGRQPRLVIGRDNRPSGTALSTALQRGIVASGGAVVDIGEAPTPALYFAVHNLGVDGGVQVTGSHNPPEYNGFKLVLDGAGLHGEAIIALYERILTENYRAGEGERRVEYGLLDRYRSAIVSRHRLDRPVRAVVDCGNGVASLVAIDTLRELGADVIPLFAESDGTFPNHHPDPTVLENLVDLQAAVRLHGAELGIAFDGDADRIGAVDQHGRPIFGDQLMIIYGRDAVHRFGKGISVIYDVKCSDLLETALAEAGARPVMWKTGHSLIKAKMRQESSPLAGEMSGHIFFGGDWFGFDDALFAAARLLEVVSAGPSGIGRLLEDLPATFVTPEIRIACADEVKFDVVAAAAEHFGALYPIETLDGVRIRWPDGWGLCRASNTQAVLVLRFEARTAEQRDAHQAEVTEWLYRHGIAG